MRLLGTAFLLLVLVSVNCLLGTRLMVDEEALPPMGRFLSPQEGFWRNAEAIGHRAPEVVELNGLSDPVRICWDEHGIPHVFADNDRDLYRAQGWVVAYLRLWQMDFIARAAEGRISEVVGRKAFAFDRAKRRKGLKIGAEATLEALEADTVIAPLMHAYADGVNQYIASLSYRDLPLEFKLMAYRPEEWSPLRSIHIQQYMVDNLSGWDQDVEDTHALRILGPELFELLFPERPPGLQPTVPTDAPWPWKADTIPVPPAQKPAASYALEPVLPDPSNGSNNWAISGTRTDSGDPILANDTHLGLSFPAIWIPIQLSTPGNRVFGFAMPGACGVINGHNEHAAWGITNAPRDTKDLYHITWKDERRSEYLHEGQWLPVSYRVETIKVRGERPFVDSIPMTLHGPLVQPLGEEEGQEHADLALRWTGHDANRVQLALHLMNHVRDQDGHVEALRYFDAPAQNWAFASTSGTISMRVQGRFPNKWRGQGRTVLDGSLRTHLWQGWIPFEHTATQVDPARGFVSSANQHSVDESYPYWFFNGHLEYYRNRRINSELERMSTVTVEDVMRLQHDGYDLKAEEALSVLLPWVATMELDSTERRIHRELLEWDRVAHHDGEEHALFQNWLDRIMGALWKPLQEHAVPMGVPTVYNTVRILGDSILRSTMERALDLDAQAVVRETFRAMASERRANGPLLWRDMNNASIQHLARIPVFGVEGLPVSGTASAVNAQRGNHGPSQRLVVQLSSPPQAWIQLPGGVSGNPGSRHYDDLVHGWTTTEYVPVHFMDRSERGHTNTILRP